MHRQAQHFYPRPPRGGRLDRLHRAVNNMAFLSTPSARRATASAAAFLSTTDHFYPRPPRGGRPPAPTSQTRWVKRFLSTPSARRATRGRPEGFSPENYFYPRPPRGGRPAHRGLPFGVHQISIHALREEGDGPDHPAHAGAGHFYPRPPRGGRLQTVAVLDKMLHISIHALREEGDARKARRFFA